MGNFHSEELVPLAFLILSHLGSFLLNQLAHAINNPSKHNFSSIYGRF